MKSRLVRSALLIVPAMLFAACGGGGGGGGGGTPPPATNTTVSQVVVTDSNAQALAAEVLETSTNIDAAQVGTGIVTGVQVDAGGGAPNAIVLATVARDLLSKSTGPAMATGATVTRNCQFGGTLTVTDTSASSTVAQTGDQFSVSASNCLDPLGNTGTQTLLNGSMTLTVVSGSFDSSSNVFPKNVNLRLVASNFAVTQGGVKSTSNGDLSIGIAESSASNSTLSLSATALSNTVEKSGAAAHAITLKNYNHTVAVTSTQATVSISATVESNNSRISSGTFSYGLSTVSPVVITSTGYVSGSLKVTANNSGLLLAVGTPNNFTLQVDTNGDGNFESSTSVTRAQLEALI
jgi:hypothetical protein